MFLLPVMFSITQIIRFGETNTRHAPAIDNKITITRLFERFLSFSISLSLTTVCQFCAFANAFFTTQ